jgi:hypothetical protein
MKFGYRNTFQLFDKGGIESLGPSGMGFSIQTLSRSFSAIQSGFLANYVFIFVLSALGLLFIFYPPSLF